MIRSKKLWLLVLSTFWFACSHSQDLKWLLGTWTGPVTRVGKIHLTKAIVIDSVAGSNFTGTRSNEADDENHTKIVTSVSGYFTDEKFYMQTEKVLYEKDPPHDAWINCSSCPFLNRIIISHDTVFLHCEISGCNKYCNGVSVYYKLLPDFDTATQRQVVSLFGDSSYILTFKPYDKNSLPVVASNQDKKTLDAAAPSITATILAKKRQQAVDDSLKNVAMLEQKQHQQQVNDSLKAIALIALKRQQQVDDSLKNAVIAEKKRQKQVDDSLRNAAMVAKKRQQQVDDSLKVVALIALKRQQHVDDSLRNATTVAKKRQQQVDDSLKVVALVALKRQQHVDDSLRNAAAIAKKRQQEVDDSLKAVAVIAYKKHVDDSLKNTAATAAGQPVVAASKALEQRTNVLVQSFHINTPDILIELFDNAEIDGDMVSVYHNNELIVDRKKLLREPITMTIHADSANRMHEFILIADNLGTIPPNTALMRITAGKQKYQLTVKTDLSTNAKIILYYDGN